MHASTRSGETVRRGPDRKSWLATLALWLFALALLLVSSGCSDGASPSSPGGEPPSMSFALSSRVLNVAAGQNGTATLDLTRSGGFTGP